MIHVISCAKREVLILFLTDLLCTMLHFRAERSDFYNQSNKWCRLCVEHDIDGYKCRNVTDSNYLVMLDMQHVYNVFHNVKHSNFHKYLYYYIDQYDIII